MGKVYEDCTIYSWFFCVWVGRVWRSTSDVVEGVVLRDEVEWSGMISFVLNQVVVDVVVVERVVDARVLLVLVVLMPFS